MNHFFFQVIEKRDNMFLQILHLLQTGITKCDNCYYKVTENETFLQLKDKVMKKRH